MAEIFTLQVLPFLTCLVMLSILGYLGIHVLKREVIFIDIALAQIAAVGAIAAHVALGVHTGSPASLGLALGATLVAAAFFAVVRRRVVQIPLEAVIGVSYAVSAAGALFLVGIAPGGHVHIQEMLAGSILWAKGDDILGSAAVFAAAGLCFYLFRHPFRTISESYEEAAARGYHTLRWDFLFYALLGLVITFAVRIAGVVVVFAFLIIPATLSTLFASGWTARLVTAWIAGALATAIGLLFAVRYDFSVGPAIALFLGASLVVVALLRAARLPRGIAAAAWLVVALALGGWFAAGATRPAGMELARSAVSSDSGPESVSDRPLSSHVAPHDHGQGNPYPDLPDQEETVDIDPVRLAALTDSGLLEQLFQAAADAEERSLVVSRMLAVDPALGARFALEFLRTDPPLLFRQAVVDALGQACGRRLDYEIDQPFQAAANQKAVGLLKETLSLP